MSTAAGRLLISPARFLNKVFFSAVFLRVYREAGLFTLEQMLLSKYQREDGTERGREVGSRSRNQTEGAQSASWFVRVWRESDDEGGGMQRETKAKKKRGHKLVGWRRKIFKPSFTSICQCTHTQNIPIPGNWDPLPSKHFHSFSLSLSVYSLSVSLSHWERQE